MIFKGRQYTKCPKVEMAAIVNHHIFFGRRDKKGELKLIPHKGHSLTNLMYGQDGYMYLSMNGEVYRAKTPRPTEPVYTTSTGE